ncbi:MAG: hypothetical protein OXQ29_04195 [Rhodospirillaceae bacterium]|nr:hypothetical protein [Rhodospirillaceae bacterium]
MKAATQQTTIAKGSWSKLRDGSWGVCVSGKLASGTVVEVCRRGESSGEQKTLGEYESQAPWGHIYRVGEAATSGDRKWTYSEVEDMISDMDLEYRYHTRAQIWDAVRRLNAGGRL